MRWRRPTSGTLAKEAVLLAAVVIVLLPTIFVVMTAFKTQADYSLDKSLVMAAELGCEALNPHWTQLDHTVVARAHQAGLSVNVYTVNEINGMRRMLDRGVDGVFTNFPDVLRALVDSD